MCTAVEETNTEVILAVIKRSWVMGSNPATGLMLTTSSEVFITARITSEFVSSTVVHLYDFHIFTVTIHHLEGLLESNIMVC